MAQRAQLIRWCFWCVRTGVTLVFAWAGIAKALDPAAFQLTIESYRLVPPWWTFIVAAYLPWLEITTAAALWNSRTRKGAEVVLLMLTFVFLVAITSAWIRGLDIACGCFGAERSLAPKYALLLGRDLALLLALGVLAARRGQTCKVAERGQLGA